jgi:hypothetical protein
VSAVPFRLRPCESPGEAAADALSFGDPSLYIKLFTLNRVEIQAQNPAVRAGTIWYRIDQQYCFVEAVAIREGMYPLVYKVLPEMMAAQLGFSYVGRYFNMGYGYATRSLIWDDKAIAENGARSFASVYPGMTPIVKLTAIIGGSTRTPILVRHDQDAAGAAADALLLNDTSLANKLADVARLEVVTGAEGTRAGTIWYFRNANYCFVIAAVFRPEAPAEVARLAPLLASQLFGYSFVGNYSSIPADLKDKALCWDRYTGAPIPELPPISQRVSGVQDFVVTFDDVPAVNPNPDVDPWPPVVCESPDNHRWEAGWNYDGCLWSYQSSPGGDYSWSSNSDGLGGSWNQNTTPTDPPSSPGDGYNWDGYNWNYVSHECANGATWTAPAGPIYWGTSAYGSWTCNESPSCDNPEDHRWQSGWTWDGCHWSESQSPGSDYFWSSNSDGLGGSWYYSGYTDPGSGSGNGYPSYGTEIGTYSNNITVNVGCGDWVVGTDSGTTYADGNGGSYNSGSTSYVPSGTYIGNCNEQNYYSDGTGGYYTGA